MADLARAIWGIPVILQAERDSVFPTPERDQRYQDRTTGGIYRYDGTAWVLDSVPLPLDGDIVDASSRTIAVKAIHRAIGGYPPDGVTMLGDSITANLGTLSDWFGAEASAWVNAGVGGNTSDQVLARVATDVSRANCDTCLLMVGINDFISGQTPANVLGYIQQIVADLVSRDIRPLLGTVLPTRSDYANAATLSTKTIALNALLRTYAAENGIVLVDYYPAFLDPAGGVYADATLLNADGLHPNDASGNVVLTTLAAAALKLDEFRASIHRVLGLLSAGPVIANSGIVLGGAGSTTALDYSAAFGVFLRGKTGSQYDFSIFTPGGNPVGGVLPGTVNLQIEGMIQSKARLLAAYENVVYSANMSPNCSLGNRSIITATNGTAFTIAAPTNPLDGQVLTITIRNASGGALGAATWNAVFKMAAWTQPANGFSRSITFQYNGTNWVEIGRTPADVPN